LAPTLHLIPKIGVFVAYADNILLLAKGKEDVVLMSKVLRSALQAHPVGPFQPKMKQFDADQPVRFLSHKLTFKNGLVHIEVDDHKLQEFKHRVTSEVTFLKKANGKLPPATLERRSQKLAKYIDSWTKSFKLGDGVQDMRDHWLGELKLLSQAVSHAQSEA
jgi:hypothetical protein